MNDDTLPLYPGTTSNLQMDHMSQPAQSAPPNTLPPAQFTRATLLLGPENTVTTCPFCQTQVRTTIKHTTTTRTHITSVLCGFICCCCCIPYCCASAKNTDHYCPSCMKFLGTYEK